MIILSYLEELILAMFNILNLSGKELYFLDFQNKYYMKNWKLLIKFNNSQKNC